MRNKLLVRTAALAVVAVVTAAILLVIFNSKSSALDGVGLRKGAAMGFALESPDFNPGGDIPSQLTCDGEDASPVLRWDGAPAGTKSLSLVTEDPDAPSGTFIHWVLYDLPETAHEMPSHVPTEKQLSNGARQGRNSFGRIGYGGPCPPRGPAHRYFFRLFALDSRLDLAPGASRDQLDRAMKGHVLAQAELMGRYKRR